MTASLEKQLAALLPHQRWFGGKGRPITDLTILSDTPLTPDVRHLVLNVRQGSDSALYQHFLAEGPPPLLSLIAKAEDHGPLRFRRLGEIDTALTPRELGVEQSNTSLVYGQSYICKVFRQLTPGISPDLELTRALTGHGQVPELYGWLEMDLDGVPTTLGMLSEFLSTGTDGWKLAVRDAAEGGDFSAQARELGEATARVHRDLAAVFGVTDLPASAVRSLAMDMKARLETACAQVPDLLPYQRKIDEAYDDLADHGGLAAQRVHGDFHLGQVMHTEQGWKILDFEGEPSKSLQERRAPAHPLRDVAGMLRSFEYAAHYRPGPEARTWARRSREAFVDGYASAGGPDPATHPVPMRAFEFDKAVYEVVYEARNRPDWIHIPLTSFT
jgi:maltokinase